MADPSFSFEFFPAKSDEASARLMETAHALAATGPAFMTMTFGAGGSSRAGTFDLAARMARETGVPIAAHLTYLGLDAPTIEDYTRRLWAANVRHIVALRGDAPKDAHGNIQQGFARPYADTPDFVKALKKIHPFEISVAAYPEKHPKAESWQSDIDNLKAKCEAGATRAITQFFFNNADYYRFLERTAAAGIKTPIVPGLLPIANFANIQSFAGRCGAAVPTPLCNRFDGASEADAQQIAKDVLREQIEDLRAHGATHFHIYTLNRADFSLFATQLLKK